MKAKTINNSTNLVEPVKTKLEPGKLYVIENGFKNVSLGLFLNYNEKGWINFLIGKRQNCFPRDWIKDIYEYEDNEEWYQERRRQNLLNQEDSL